MGPSIKDVREKGRGGLTKNGQVRIGVRYLDVHSKNFPYCGKPISKGFRTFGNPNPFPRWTRKTLQRFLIEKKWVSEPSETLNRFPTVTKLETDKGFRISETDCFPQKPFSVSDFVTIGNLLRVSESIWETDLGFRTFGNLLRSVSHNTEIFQSVREFISIFLNIFGNKFFQTGRPGRVGRKRTGRAVPKSKWLREGYDYHQVRRNFL